MPEQRPAKWLSEDVVRERFLELTQGNIYYISGYEGRIKYCTVKCLNCGQIFQKKLANTKNTGGNGCKLCSQRLSHKEFLQKIEKIGRDDIILLENYVNYNTKIKVAYTTCEHIEYKSPKGILLGQGCGNVTCVGKKIKKIKIKSQEKFDQEIYDLVGNEYTYLENYKADGVAILCKHNTCGHEWQSYPTNFLRGSRCPRCAFSGESKGEKEIREILEILEIPYQQEYKIKIPAYGKHHLYFDFALLSEQNIVAFIEYQGEQHYKPVEKFGGEEAFISQRIRDNAKKEYCKNNNIFLIEIPYWEKDIAKILEKHLFKLSLL